MLYAVFHNPPSLSPLHPILLQHYHSDTTPSSPLPPTSSSHHLFFSQLSPPSFFSSPSLIVQHSFVHCITTSIIPSIHLSLPRLPSFPRLSLTFSHFISLSFSSGVSCDLQYHVSRMSSAFKAADRLCLVLLTHAHTLTDVSDTKSCVGLHS